MLTFKSVSNAADSALVLDSLGGDKDAFCQIVMRYQTLLCSIAYSAIGDIKLSEDVAQEAFVEAWKKLDSLSDPQKLKAWLCGIVRFKVSHHRRSDKRQLEDDIDELSSSSSSVLTEDNLDKGAIRKQQEALMWKTLQSLDSTYREPLILFYREGQSVEAVAQNLDLTTETTKKRLSRGRKLLERSITGLIENTLKHSAPSMAFTTGVLTIISTISPPAKAAAITTSVVKTSSFLNLPTWLTIFGSSSGLISAFFGLRASLDQSRTSRERRLVFKSVSIFLGIALLFVVGLLSLRLLVSSYPSATLPIAISAQAIVLLFVVSYVWLTFAMVKATRLMRMQERIFNPDAFTDPAAQKNAKQREYKSKLTLLGIPLLHMQFGMPEEDYQPAFGWIAGGSHAKALLFAWGGTAIAPISVGIVSVGIVSIGAVGVGVFAAGTTAIGAFAFGAAAMGLYAYSSLSSLAFEGAVSGGFAIAQDAAVGAIAYARQANTELAHQLVALKSFEQHYHWALLAIAIFVLVPAIWHSNKVRKRMRKHPSH